MPAGGDMGTFLYDNTTRAEFDDQELAHLQIVILAKLRRGESFSFSWTKAAPEVGRITVWLDRHIPVLFDFDTEELPEIHRPWLEQLSRNANSTTGLRLTPNPVGPDPAASDSRDLHLTRS